jgi:hypothetical protein
MRAVYLPGITGKASSVTNVAAVTRPVDLLVERALHNPYFREGLLRLVGVSSTGRAVRASMHSPRDGESEARRSQVVSETPRL